MAGDQHFSLERKRLSDWHTVWDAFILWSGYVILAALDQSSEAAPRPLSGPGFLSVPPLRRIMSLLFSHRADSDWLWQWGPGVSSPPCSVRLVRHQKRAQESSLTAWGPRTFLRRLILFHTAVGMDFSNYTPHSLSSFSKSSGNWLVTLQWRESRMHLSMEHIAVWNLPW